jgi:hypothetical protein
MNPDYFNFGLGLGAIPSVDDPVVVDRNSDLYPDPSSNLEVFGIDHNGEQRAYVVTDLSRHEVFNDKYPGNTDTHVAVTY